MSVLHESDYPSLNCGFPNASCLSIAVVGLRVLIYGLGEIKGSSKPIAVLIAKHGRRNKQQNMAGFASGVLGYARQEESVSKRDLIVVTIDQPNHGERTLERAGNESFDKNPRHPLDMYATITHASRDISFLIDFLAAYIFPSGERQIEEYAVVGISLGGHAAWRVLRDDPRVKVAIPIIGTPSEGFLDLLGPRAVESGIALEPPVLPSTLKAFIEASTIQLNPSPYKDKKILVLSGKEDKLVPYAAGQKYVEEIRESGVGLGGCVEVWVQDGVGHACSKEMVKRTAEWLVRWSL